MEEEEEEKAERNIIYVSFIGVITCMVFLGVTLFGHLTSKYITVCHKAVDLYTCIDRTEKVTRLAFIHSCIHVQLSN